MDWIIDNIVVILLVWIGLSFGFNIYYSIWSQRKLNKALIEAEEIMRIYSEALKRIEKKND